MATVYISSHHPDPANELAAALTAAGHDVVSRWHSEAAPRPAADDAAAWQEKAARNLTAVRGAAVLALVAGPDKYPGGKFVEAGYAIGRGIHVVVVGRVENGMLYHPLVSRVDDAAGLMALLGPNAG